MNKKGKEKKKKKNTAGEPSKISVYKALFGLL